MVQAEFDRVRFFADVFLFLAFLDRGRFFQQALFFFGLGFGLVFGKQFEGLRGGVAVEGVGGCELGNRGGNFEAEVEDFALALEADVFRPFHHAREVAAWLDVLTDTEIARAFLDEGVL